jgi:hypothetical protein
MTTSQYDHTVQDLFQLENSYAALLDNDESVGPYASNSITAVSRLVIEKYMTAAEQVAADADIGALDNCNLLTSNAVECATEFIESMGKRILRRPLTKSQTETYLGLYQTFNDRGHVDGLRVVVQAMLQDPNFLYFPDFHLHQGPLHGKLALLDAHALASRLSYFLWNSAPDDTLLAAAEDGSLLKEDVLQAQAVRMLADPKARRGIRRFHLQWLGADNLEMVAKDPELFPNYTPEVVAGLQQETSDFANYIIRHGDGELETLLTADFTILNPAIADFYSVPDGANLEPDTPSWLDSSRRSGILTHGSFLASQAHYQLSSLSLRGKVVREHLLCQDLPDPPPDVDLTLPNLEPGATTREQVEAHAANPSCSGCHMMIDPIGFGFEEFDAIGQYRIDDNGSPIDSTGQMINTDIDGEFHGAAQLSTKLADSQMVRWCFTQQWYQFALGRQINDHDGCSLKAGFQSLEKPANIRELILTIITSDSFRHRRIIQ